MPKDTPRTWLASRGAGGDANAERRLADAIEAGNEAVSPTRRSARQREARRYALGILRDVSSSPALRTGRPLDAGEITTFLSDFLDSAQLPTSVRTEARDAAMRIVAKIIEGDRAGADVLSREAAFDLGDRLANSPWEKPEGADPRALADRIPRQ